MNNLSLAYQGRDLVILAISSDVQGKEVVAPFVEDYDLAFSVLLDPQNIVGSRLGVGGIPTSDVLDK
jgi:hypothetical protein